MKDRVPLYPGRVKLTPVSGQENTYDMVRADQPTQEGTPLNKNSLLKDATAALYGLGSDAVPDDVFAKVLGLGSFYLWEKKGQIPIISEESAGEYIAASNQTTTVHFSYNVDIENGSVQLVNASVLSDVTMSSFVGSENVGVCFYVETEVTFSSCTFLANTIYKINSKGYNSTGNYWYGDFSTLKVGSAIGVAGYVLTKTNTAPVEEGYTFVSKGQLGAGIGGAKIAAGSYAGTGGYGYSNPNKLTFEFEPKLVFIHNSSDGRYQMCAINGDSQCISGIVVSNQYIVETAWLGNKISWYSNDNGAIQQLNESGVVYNYAAIG